MHTKGMEKLGFWEEEYKSVVIGMMETRYKTFLQPKGTGNTSRDRIADKFVSGGFQLMNFIVNLVWSK